VPDKTPGAIRRFRKRPALVEMIRWDGSERARLLIAEHSGKPVPADTQQGALNVWVQKSAAWMWLPPGDWAALEADGAGIYPLADEVRVASYEAAGSDEAPERTELERLRSGGRELGRTVTHMSRTMRAAQIEMRQNGAGKAMEWILNAIPDVDDNDPADQWNGTESATEWLDRTAEVAGE
jgi:hypothetical protein